MSDLTAAKKRQYVEERWQEVTSGWSIYGKQVTLPTKPSTTFLGYEKLADAYAVAYDFTIQREEEIRLVEEEIDQTEYHIAAGGNITVLQRMLNKQQAELDRLKRGMKEGKDA